MLPQQKQGWTTVTDIEAYKKMTWSYLINVKMSWQYDGIAYLFRKAGIPIYGKDCGSLKTNHPIMTMAVPQSRDKNYGVDLYVPVEKKKKALKLIENWDLVKEAAAKEAEEGKAHYEAFEKEALAAKERNRSAYKAKSNREKIQSFVASVFPRFAANEG